MARYQQPEFEARPEVTSLAAGFNSYVETKCHTFRIRNTGSTSITLTVGSVPFEVQAGRSWGLDTADPRVVIRQPVLVQLPDEAGAVALVERILLIKL
ncbi:hypothetical protein HER32_00300 [Hymenobacter sp. BT18]|uniref:hypothetical protein n=1 Tax=Hymenobacter sp. BT18 TaxID=2835648 RepID=UPI00143E5F46|nr:hypothetical protein [Hymenobacter sp. BT18]QIX59716.1 hypothetical protein HER32_00300 [Hymenobacter sp. BT18]